MRAACTILAMVAVLTGCAPKTRASRVTTPHQSMQPVMQRQILNAIDAGEGNPRVRELRQRMVTHPGDVKLRIELAEEYGKSGLRELELEHLRLAVERFPEAEAAVVALSRSLVRADRAAEAASRLGEYLAKHEKASATVFSWAGIAQDKMQNVQAGESWHRKAVERAPSRDALHNNLGYNLMMQGRKADAAEEFRRALDLNPSSETARNNLGLALGDQPAAAITQFRQTSDLAVAHNNLATYLFEKGDWAGARRELELALEYRRDMPQILENLRKVSALDGTPIHVPQTDNRSIWQMFARGLKHTFVPGEERHSTGTADAGR